MDKSTQQPVAEVYYGNYGGNTRGVGFVSVRSLVSADELPPPGTKLYATLPASHDVLMAAHERIAELEEELTTAAEWRRLALQFDNHRIEAIAHLRCLLENPESHAAAANRFLCAPPMSGEQVLAERVAAIAAAKEAQKPKDI